MKRPAFTLVEVLVAVATIAMLIAILLPTLRRSRMQAEAVICSSNVKQLLYGLFSYENENQILPQSFDRPPTGPPPDGYPGNGQYDRKGWWWFNFIEGFYKKYKGNRMVVCCPAKRLSVAGLQNNVLCSNYGINRSICKSSDDRQKQREEFVGLPLRTSNISRASETLLIVDSGYATISWWHATDIPPVVLGKTVIEDTAYIPGLWINKNRNLWPGMERDAINGRHPNKTVNVGFVDGHTSRVKADDLFVEKTIDGYKNKIPLWVPK